MPAEDPPAGSPSGSHQPGVPSFTFLPWAPAAVHSPPTRRASLQRMRAASALLARPSACLPSPRRHSVLLATGSCRPPSPGCPRDVKKAVGMVSGPLRESSRARQTLWFASCSPASRQRPQAAWDGSRSHVPPSPLLERISKLLKEIKCHCSVWKCHVLLDAAVHVV